MAKRSEIECGHCGETIQSLEGDEAIDLETHHYAQHNPAYRWFEGLVLCPQCNEIPILPDFGTCTACEATWRFEVWVQRGKPQDSIGRMILF